VGRVLGESEREGAYEELKACALAVVSCVCMGGEGERSICCVGMLKVTRKVPESSVVRGHDIRQLLDQSLCCLGSMRNIIDEGKANDFLNKVRI